MGASIKWGMLVLLVASCLIGCRLTTDSPPYHVEMSAEPPDFSAGLGSELSVVITFKGPVPREHLESIASAVSWRSISGRVTTVETTIVEQPEKTISKIIIAPKEDLEPGWQLVGVSGELPSLPPPDVLHPMLAEVEGDLLGIRINTERALVVQRITGNIADSGEHAFMVAFNGEAIYRPGAVRLQREGWLCDENYADVGDVRQRKVNEGERVVGVGIICVPLEEDGATAPGLDGFRLVVAEGIVSTDGVPLSEFRSGEPSFEVLVRTADAHDPNSEALHWDVSR